MTTRTTMPHLEAEIEDDARLELETPGAEIARLSNPTVPITINELSALGAGALVVLETRVLVLSTSRKSGLRLTAPDDWTLNIDKAGRVTGYLADVGCQRCRSVLGIDVYNIRDKERIPAQGEPFMCVVTGDGRSNITLARVEAIEGGRASDEKYFTSRGLAGHALELNVRKAARANLDGRIVRQLAGFNRLPIDELIDAWDGTGKKIEDCAKGHGYGSQDERHGATREGTPDVPPPTCPICKDANGNPLPLVYRTKGFYGCRNYDRHPEKKVIVDAAEWVAKQASAAKATKAPPPAEDDRAAIDDAKRQDAELAAREGKRGR